MKPDTFDWLTIVWRSLLCRCEMKTLKNRNKLHYHSSHTLLCAQNEYLFILQYFHALAYWKRIRFITSHLFKVYVLHKAIWYVTAVTPYTKCTDMIMKSNQLLSSSCSPFSSIFDSRCQRRCINDFWTRYFNML